MPIKVTVPSLISAMSAAKYTVFQNDSKPFNLNIVGIRATNPVPNKFNDTLAVFWKYEGQWNLFATQITTLPGDYWMKNPMNTKGCAILVPGQYRSVYKLDQHNGKYLALCQRNGVVSVYRDNNKDVIWDMDPATITTGMYGINIHRASAYSELENVGMNSAGCQVVQDPNEYKTLIFLAEQAKEQWGNSFTYSLMDQKTLDET
tara:strand:+ start:1133 stop:1744 length:612 start_codon:yes stop_codon:yes gene_type:complete